MIKIFPSLISSDILNLEQVITEFDDHCAGYHLDVMDFHFVPNLTFGPSFINAIRRKTKKQLQVHLMVEYPENYIDRMELSENDIICVHIESPTKSTIPILFERIRSKGLIASVAINPFTPLEALITLRTKLEHVLLMSVNPGFSGQEFMPHAIERLKALNIFRLANDLDFTIAIDGGITQDILASLIENGADEVAIASAIFNTADPIHALKTLIR